MKAAIVSTIGQPPRCGDHEEPVPGSGEVIVHLDAAGLHPLVKAMASGKHYLHAPTPPFIVGIDGAGRREDGTRVYCCFPRRPFGTMAERVVVPAAMCIPLPEGLGSATAAAIGNPGMSSWLALRWKARLAAGETVLILGATGAAGHLAVQFAKLLGAGRVIAAGRNPAALAELQRLGADATIRLDQAAESLHAAFLAEVGAVDVVVDYVWGPPTEAFLRALAQQATRAAGRRVRLVEVGESAGPTLTLAAGLLRGQGLEISGSGIGSASQAQIMEALPQFFRLAASGQIRFEVEKVPLAQVEAAWARKTEGSRIVIIP